MRIVFLVLLFSFCSKFHAQTWNKKDSAWFDRKNRYYYMGIQANPLLQQFISFNSNSSINNNPYLFCYSVNNANRGIGFALGTGLSVTQSSTNDGVASVTVENDNATIRIGFEKKYMQTSRFIPFWGIDMGMGYVSNKTTSTLNQSFNNNTTKIETTKGFFGPSFRSGVHYTVSRHILLGTEFFFNVQIAITQTTVQNGNERPTTNSSTSPFNVGFQAPTALFLMFRF